METKNCTCAEGFSRQTDDGELIPTGLHVHDCAYIKRRNAALDEAEAIATRAANGKRHGRGWHKAFFDAVNELSAERRSTW